MFLGYLRVFSKCLGNPQEIIVRSNISFLRQFFSKKLEYQVTRAAAFWLQDLVSQYPLQGAMGQKYATSDTESFACKPDFGFHVAAM